jgi:hypothetical protein
LVVNATPGFVPPPTLAATSTSTGPSADASRVTKSVQTPMAVTGKRIEAQDVTLVATLHSVSMRLVKCGACAGDVSDEAKACPKCGQPTPRAKRTAWAYPLGIVIVSGVVLWFLVHLGAQMVKGVQDLIPSSGVAGQSGSELP